MRNFIKIIFFIGVLLSAIPLSAQWSLPLSRETNQRLEPEILKYDLGFFTCLKPYNNLRVSQMVNMDSILGFEGRKRYSRVGRKLFHESFLKVDSPSFFLAVDPLFDFSIGKEQGNSQRIMTNTRGVVVRCRMGNTIGIESSFYENQSIFPKIWDDFILTYRVAPGQGRAKRFGQTGWDYAYSSGSISWHPRGIFSLQLGQDKHFVGDGYRSLLLSDVSTNYPFIRFAFAWKNVQYTRIVALFQNIDYEKLGWDIREFPKKIGSFHLVSLNLFKRLQVSLFEGTILKNPYEGGEFRLNFDVLDPVPFLTTIFRSSAKLDQQNTVGGLNLNWKLSPFIQLYNQWSFDALLHFRNADSGFLNKYGYQLGIKYYNAFTLRNLYLQAEFNKVQPYTYSQTDSTIAYTHFAQPLAHPLGANFYEVVGIMNYRIKRWYMEYSVITARYGEGTKTENTGKDIFRPLTSLDGNFLQGTKTDLITHQARLSWYLNPATYSCFSIGIYRQRLKSAVSNKSTNVIFVSFSTRLRNLYYDF